MAKTEAGWVEPAANSCLYPPLTEPGCSCLLLLLMGKERWFLPAWPAASRHKGICCIISSSIIDLHFLLLGSLIAVPLVVKLYSLSEQPYVFFPAMGLQNAHLPRLYNRTILFSFFPLMLFLYPIASSLFLDDG